MLRVCKPVQVDTTGAYGYGLGFSNPRPTRTLSTSLSSLSTRDPPREQGLAAMWGECWVSFVILSSSAWLVTIRLALQTPSRRT